VDLAPLRRIVRRNVPEGRVGPFCRDLSDVAKGGKWGEVGSGYTEHPRASALGFARSLEGRPLWHVTGHPAIFVPTCRLLEISLNRRLPRTFQRVLLLLARRTDKQSSNGTMGKTGRAVISASACLTPYLALLAMERISRDLYARSKAACPT
jgi:hypothetical protein